MVYEPMVEQDLITRPRYVIKEAQLTPEVDDVAVSLSPILVDVKSHLKDKDKLDKFTDKFKKVDAVRVLAGATTKLEDGSWASPDYWKSDNNGLASGAVVRVAAAAVISEANKNCVVEVGSHFRDESKPSPSKIMFEELKQLGVDEDRINNDRDSFDSISEILRFLDEAIRNGWEEIDVVTNKYHIPRINEFLDNDNLEWLAMDLEMTANVKKALLMIKNGTLNVKVIAAEDVIMEFNEDIYNKYIKDVYNTDVYEKRVEKEISGMVRIEKEGKYKRKDKNGKEILMERS